MKKNFKKVGMILSMVAMVSFTMTNCGETAEDATEGANAVEEGVNTTTDAVEEAGADALNKVENAIH